MSTMVLTRNELAATGLHLLSFEGVPSGFQVAGQFVTAGVGEGKPSFFAIASALGEPLQLLVKCSGDMAEALCALEPGAEVSVSDVMGKGFPMDALAGKPLVVLVNGSGIAAVRALLHGEVAAGLPRPVHLFFGVISPAHRAFSADLERWANAGVAVHTVVDPAGAPGWDGPAGYVQDIAKDVGAMTAESAVVLVGLPVMVDHAKALCASLGLPEDCVVTNF